ncbi:hypothetical protein [Yinghuangia soli]|uniref:Uncharacterized protein n=1 Tax=Yinghuangia soli TaxID=2908204 RepID=A0AA41PXF5_9ACTN|nr:hypothetical protein [Yinghuangia soli]MCF2526614.1 hypothetical protein [Yinghuangia soli]
MSSDQVKHLEFIQAIVARLGNGSFLIKGWTMTIAGAFFGVAANKSSWQIAAVTLIPIVGFWMLDSYYLRQERLFRKLYDDVRKPATAVEPYSMNIQPYLAIVRWPDVIRSHTMVNFYGLLTVASLAIITATALHR